MNWTIPNKQGWKQWDGKASNRVGETLKELPYSVLSWNQQHMPCRLYVSRKLLPLRTAALATTKTIRTWPDEALQQLQDCPHTTRTFWNIQTWRCTVLAGLSQPQALDDQGRPLAAFRFSDRVRYNAKSHYRWKITWQQQQAGVAGSTAHHRVQEQSQSCPRWYFTSRAVESLLVLKCSHQRHVSHINKSILTVEECDMRRSVHAINPLTVTAHTSVKKTWGPHTSGECTFI